MSNNVSPLLRKPALVIAAIAAFVTLFTPNVRAQLVWAVGIDDNGWPAGDGGGPNTSFVQENGTINALPGSPTSTEAAMGADNDYYFAGTYTTVITGNGVYVPVGAVAVNEEAAERAFAAADNDLRYHFNLPNSLSPHDLLSVTFDANNLHDGNPDTRYGIEVYFNGVLVQTQIVIRAAQLDTDYTTPQFTLSSVNAQVGPGFDNIVSLRGVNYNAEGGGNWMGIDYVQLNSTPGVPPTAGGYADAVAADGPIAYWRFSDSPPTAVNSGSLGATANGTYFDNATVGSQAPTFPGFEASNTALQLDGAGDYVGTAISLMNSRPVFTISGWMRRNADQANRTGLWGQNDIVEFGYINNNTIELWTDNGLHQSPDPTVNPIPNGEWAHFAVVSEGSPGTALMYTNGVLANTRLHTLPADNTFPFNIGGGGVFDALAANGNYFNGQIDEVAVFDKALTAQQIAAQYRAAFIASSPLPNALNIGIGGTQNDIGTVTHNGGGSFTIVGGGNDIWDMHDEFTYAYTDRVGDFDVRVRVESLAANARWSKAGLMIRETAAEDSRMLFLRVTPPDVPTSSGGNGANDVRLSYRSGHFASQTDVDPGENDGRHEEPTAGWPVPAYPNAWLRLVRSGNLFTAYSGVDGVVWTEIANQDTGAGSWSTGGGPFKDDVLIGLAASRHSGGLTATAEFRDFSFAPVPFTLLQASSRGNPNAVLVQYSSAPDAGHLEPLSYDFTGGQTIASITPGPRPNSYWLNLSAPLTEGDSYTVTAFTVTQGGVGPAVDNDTFVHGAGYEARPIHVGHNKTREGGDTVLDNTSYLRGLFSQADGQAALEGGKDGFFEDALPDNNSNERYYAKIFGILNITTPGEYRFACSSDDVGNLYLSSNEDPANKTRIAREPEWNGSRQYATADRRAGQPNQSAAINLAAGQYYLEYTYAEGGGGNNGSAAWQPPGGPAFTNGQEPIPGSAFAPTRYYNAGDRGALFNTLGPVQILTQPVAQIVAALQPVTFRVRADGTPAYSYQWRKDGAPIPGATGPSYTIPLTQPSDNGAVFSVSVANEFSIAVSAGAQLTVLVPNPPHLVSAGPVSIATPSPEVALNRVLLKFDNRLQTASAQDPGHYTIAGLNVTAATLQPGGSNVVLTTSTQTEGATYTVSVLDVLEGTGTFPVEPNPSTASFEAMAFAPGYVVRETYLAYTAGVDPLTGNTALLANPNITCLNTLWEFNSVDTFDNYGGRIRSYFTPTVSGEHLFFLATDDPGRLFLSTDADPANRVLIASEATWAGRRAWTGARENAAPPDAPPGTLAPNVSLPVNLVAGTRYYMESYFIEGGGGDHMAVAVQAPGQSQPSNGSSPIPSAYTGLYVTPAGASAQITQNPVDVTGPANGTVNFTANGVGSSPVCGASTIFQWYKNGLAIPGANSPVLTLGPLAEVDNGAKFKFAVQAGGRRAESTEATLTVLPPQPLHVVRVSGDYSLQKITVFFDQPVDERTEGNTAIDSFRYELTETASSTIIGFASDGTRSANGLSVSFPLTSPQTIGGNYCLKVEGVESALGTLLEPGVTNVCFQAFSINPGLVTQEIYRDIGGGVAIADLRSSPKYPGAPDQVRFRGAAQANTVDEFDNYGTRISGWIRPPVSGAYNFFMSSDDAGELWLSTDQTPANIQLIASEPTWNGRREWVGTARRNAAAPENRSSTLFPSGIELVAGQLYYFEALMKEGGGGDNLAMTWQLPGAPMPGGNTWALAGDYIATLTDPNGSINILTQPVDRSVEENTVVNFSVVATGTSAGVPTTDLYYQWQRLLPGAGQEWTPITTTTPNGTEATYSPTVTVADNGSKYRVRVFVPGASATSAEVTLEVYHINSPPKFTCGPNQTVLEDAPAQSIAGWATDIQKHSIAQDRFIRFGTLPPNSALFDPLALLDGGILKLTRANDPGNFGGFVLNLPGPQTFPTFNAAWKSYIGGGGGGGADGYSFNVGTDLATSGVGEEGTGTGLTVAVDTFDNTDIETPDVGIEINWGGVRIASQTIPKDNDGSGNYLRKSAFVDASVSVSAAGVATFTYDGNVISAPLPGYAGITADKIIFGARTGGANDNQWIDDLTGNEWLDSFLLDAATPELSQAVEFLVTNSDPSRFTVQPAVSPNGTLSYTLAPNACGPVTVTVVAKDDGGTAHGGNDTSLPCTFVIDISCVNDCPVAAGQSITTEVGAEVNFQLAATDADGDALQYAVAQPPLHGIVTVNANSGAASYAPNAGYTGPDSFTFTAKDATCTSQPATVTITVRSSNTAPIAKITATGLVDFTPDIANQVLISCNGSNACLSLDGLLSTDAETATELLTYQWFLDPSSLPFDSGIQIHTCLDIGTHTIRLAVTDPGNLTGYDTLTIDVLSAGEAIEELITEINDSTIARGNKRPFIATLKAAAASADRGSNESAQNQLHALQNKLRAQVAKDNPAEAARWTRLAQAIIDGLACEP